MAHEEPDAWASVGEALHRDKAIIAPVSGSRVHQTIALAWDQALLSALGITFEHVVGRRGGRPNGHGTDHLAVI